MKRASLSILIIFSCLLATAQSNWLGTPILLDVDNPSVKKVFTIMMEEHSIPLSYSDDLVPLKKQLFLEKDRTYTVAQILSAVCQDENLDFFSRYGQVYIKYYDRPLSEYTYTVYGLVKDQKSGEPLIGATVFVDSLNIGVLSNAYGLYSLTLPRGDYTINASYLGYEINSESVKLTGNRHVTFKMIPKVIQMGNVVVDDLDYRELKSINVLSGTNRLDMEMVGDIPYLGEVDVFQSSLLLPGINNIGEGLSGVNVRGGAADQNLILLDEAVIYNANHFFGLISVFNPDAVQDVEIIKGDLPAKYGGRNSSIMHIRQKEGNENEFHLSGGLGLITSRLMAEGPIVPERINYLVSARSTFWNFLLNNVNDSRLDNVRASFQDINAKVRYNVNYKNKVYVSAYMGNDANKFNLGTRQNWGNRAISMRWNKIMAKKHLFNATGYFTQYRYVVTGERDDAEFVGESKITDLAAKFDVTSYFNPKNIMEYGGQVIFHRLSPGIRTPGPGSAANPLQLPIERGLEPSIYASYEKQLSNRWTAYLGGRLSSFYNYGDADVLKYNPSLSQYDTLSSTAGQSAIWYMDILPRALLKYQISSDMSIKMGYFQAVQYMQLLSNTLSPAYWDTWDMSGRGMLPTRTRQASLGMYKYFEELDFNASAELYIKDLDNTVEFRNGANLSFNQFVETELLNGKERVFGLELFAKKTFGKLKGWVSYTLSKAEKRIPGNEVWPSVNGGNYFPSDFDRRHDFAITGVYQLNTRLSLSSNFVFYTGRPYSFPDQKYEVDGVLVPNYPDRNHQRLDNYHRMDLSATLAGKPLKKDGSHRNFESSWVFSLYNLYARKNTQDYLFTYREDDSTKPEIQRLYMLGTVIPSITYNFRF